jgi:WD40 repeat protein
MSHKVGTNITPVESVEDVTFQATRPAAFAVAFGLTVASLVVWHESRQTRAADHRIVSIALSSSGRWIATGTRTGSITLLDLELPWHRQRINASSGQLNDLQFSPDQRLLAVANRRLTVYSVEDLSLSHSLRSDDRNYGTARFSSDGRHLLTISSLAIEVLDVDSGQTPLTVCCSTIYGEIAYSPDGLTIVSAGHWPVLWDARSGRVVRELTHDREFQTLRPIAFDMVRGWILMGSQDGRVYAWDLRTGDRTATSRAQIGYVDTIAVLLDTPWIAYSSFGGPVRLWNPDTGMETLLGPTTTSNLVTGTQPHSVLLGTESGFIELWNVSEKRMFNRYDLR